MKKFNSNHLRLTVFLAVCPLATYNMAKAQTSATENANQLQWSKLQAANSRIEACHVVWKRVQRIHPIAEADPEKWAARAIESSRQQGMSDEQAQQMGAVERREAIRSKQGRVINSTLELTRVGNSVLSQIRHPDPEYRSRAIEFSNGSISLYSQTQVKGKPHLAPNGTLTNDPEDVLRMSSSGPEVVRMLLGIPLNQSFGPQNPVVSRDNATLTVQPTGSYVVEQKPQGDEKNWAHSTLFTFAEGDFYPLSFEVFDTKATVKNSKPIDQRGNALMRVVATGYKKYEGGIWFPSKITVTKPNATTEYSLVSAKFNDEVDPADLLLPPKLRVADARFGYGPKLAIYKVKDGKLPSDEEVKALIATDDQAKQSKEKAEKEVVPKSELSLLPFAAGLGLISLGAVLLLNSGNRKK